MAYGANTNWDNEEKYLNGLISQGGGNAAWAQNQLNELNAARSQYSGGNSYGNTSGGYTQQDVDNYWKNDKTDYSANMLNAQSRAEFNAWAQDRQHKAAAQGIDISGQNGAAASNAQLYEQWRANNYNNAERDSYVNGGKSYGGYYGMDSEGHWGYYDDSALTRKSATGTWDQYASSDGGYVRTDARGVPDMTIQDKSRAGQTVYLKTPQGQWKVKYNANGYPVDVTKDGLGFNQLYSGPMYAAKADSDQGITSREMMYDEYGTPYIGQGGISWDQFNALETARNRPTDAVHMNYQSGTRDQYDRILAERGNREGIGPVAGAELGLTPIQNPGGYAENPGRGVTSPQSVGGGGASYSGGSSGASYGGGSPSGGGSGSVNGGYTGGSGYDLTEYIRAKQAAALESELAGLKEAYEKSMNGYNDQLSRLPQGYDAARNSAAAQDAIARRNFDERAVAMGLNSGTSGQAELSRAAALQAALSGIDQQQQNATSDLELQMRNLEAQYQSAIAQARANGDAQLAQSLYNELVRVQNLQRSDAQRAQEYQLEMAKLGASYGDYSGLNALGVNTSSYEAQLAAQQAAAQEAANAYEPTFTVAQVTSAIKNGWITDQVLRDYEYYYGAPYGSYGGSVGAVNTVGSTGSTGTKSTGTKSSGASYNNGALTSSQVKQLQAALGVTQDGYFGPASQAAAQKKYGTTSADAAWRAYAGGTNTQSTQSNITRVDIADANTGSLYWNGRTFTSAEALAAAASSAGLTKTQLDAIARQIKALTGREVGLQPVQPEQYTK